VIRGEDYGTKCDWWSLGVMMYHLLSGRHPFYASDKQLTIEKVLNKRIARPPVLTSNDAWDLIMNLLNRDPEKRFSHVEMKKHPFFSSIDWEKMSLKKLPPPFQISVDGPHELALNEEGAAELLSQTDAKQDLDPDELYFPSFTYVSPHAY
jgi:serine/threonine protein kinase